jgi:hypothetical protein
VNDVDERIRSALIARAGQVTEADLPPSPVPAPDQPNRIPPGRRLAGGWLPPLLAAAAVIAVVAGAVAVISVVHSGHARPAHTPPPTPVVTTPVLPTPVVTTPVLPTPVVTTPAVPTPVVTTPAPGLSDATVPPSPASPPSSATNPPGATTFDLGYQPLWPFANYAQARVWEVNGRPSGHQPWHASAPDTALSFTQNILGFKELDSVTSARYDSLGAHIGVGYHDPNGVARTAAVLHLVRFGPNADSPWEVVGSDDTTFSIQTPAYGSVVTSPIEVGGHITGVDESINVAVRQLSSPGPLGTTCCQPAGGNDQPWSASASFAGATDPVLTIVASTGGHLQAVERFAIHGVRTR